MTVRSVCLSQCLSVILCLEVVFGAICGSANAISMDLPAQSMDP